MKSRRKKKGVLRQIFKWKPRGGVIILLDSSAQGYGKKLREAAREGNLSLLCEHWGAKASFQQQFHRGGDEVGSKEIMEEILLKMRPIPANETSGDVEERFVCGRMLAGPRRNAVNILFYFYLSQDIFFQQR